MTHEEYVKLHMPMLWARIRLEMTGASMPGIVEYDTAMKNAADAHREGFKLAIRVAERFELEQKTRL